MDESHKDLIIKRKKNDNDHMTFLLDCTWNGMLKIIRNVEMSMWWEDVDDFVAIEKISMNISIMVYFVFLYLLIIFIHRIGL